MLDYKNILPYYYMDFFTGRSNTLSEKTKEAYAKDLTIFYYYLFTELKDRFNYDSPREITLKDISERVTKQDIDAFIKYLEEYEIDGKTYTNSRVGLKRKIATLRSFYKYFENQEQITVNPMHKVETPKAPEHQIKSLSSEQTEKIEKLIDSGSRKKDSKAEKYHEKTKLRDMAIYKLLLGTGIRVSELVGLDLMDIDDEEQSITIIRKGGKKQTVYFNNEVYNALIDYMDNERPALLNVKPEEANNDLSAPLFVSLKHTRITARRVEMIIKEYGQYAVSSNEKVTPHSLRRTYGTKIYNETGDILLVKNALGHKSIETAQKAYINFDNERLKKLKDID